MNESHAVDSSLHLGTLRWAVLATLATKQSQWTAPQVALELGRELPRVITVLGWLRDHELVELRYWVGMDSLHMISDRGREQLRAGAQLSFDGPSPQAA